MRRKNNTFLWMNTVTRIVEDINGTPMIVTILQAARPPTMIPIPTMAIEDSVPDLKPVFT